MYQRTLAAVQEGAREVMEGALAGFLYTAVALQTWLVVIRTPRADVVESREMLGVTAKLR